MALKLLEFRDRIWSTVMKIFGNKGLIIMYEVCGVRLQPEPWNLPKNNSDL